MSSVKFKALEVPHNDVIINEKGMLSASWEKFFFDLVSRLNPLGDERSFALVNNQVSPANVDGLAFNSNNTSCAFIKYLIQRVTTSTGATESNQSGILIATFEPITGAWHVREGITTGPDSSGITFSISSGGQVQYTSSNISGTNSYQKMTYRVETLAARNGRY
jgi:hypothetical protein